MRTRDLAFLALVLLILALLLVYHTLSAVWDWVRS